MVSRHIATWCAAITWLVGTGALAQETDYIPPIYPVEVFAKLPMVSQPKLSPNGKSIAYVTSVFNGRKTVLAHPITGMEKGKTIVLPSIKQADVLYTTWANDDVLLTAYSFYGPNFLYRGLQIEQSRMFASSFETGSFNVVKASKEQKRKFRNPLTGMGSNASMAANQADILDLLPNDPEHILLAIDDDLDGDIDVRKISVKNGDYSIAQGGKKGIYSWLTDENNTPALGYSTYDDDPNLYIAKHKRKQWSFDAIYALLDKEIYPITVLEDGTTALVQARNQYGRLSLGRVSLFNGELIEWLYSHPTYDIADVYRSDITNKVVGTGYIDTRFRQVFISGIEKKVLAFINRAYPDANNRLLSSDKSGKLWLFYSYKQGQSPKVHSLNWEAKKITQFVDLYEDIEDGDVAPVQMHKIRARDGIEFEVYLTKPVGRAGPLPTILLPHGGPWSRDRIGFDAWAQFFANRGYLVLQPNFRGSTGYGIEFEDLGEKAWGQTMQDDLTDTVKWAVEQSLSHAGRICIVGGSYGGYAALMGVVKTPDLFQCAISLNGVADLPLLWNDERDFLWYKKMREEIGENRKDIKTISPYHRAKEITKPVLLIAAKDDWRVNYKHSRKMYKKLKNLKKPVKYIELKSGGHSVDVDAERIKMFKAMGKFVDAAIGGG
jgi:dienelactone hydrolase